MDALAAALKSKWGAVPQNGNLINFSVAKLLQQQSKHEAAIQAFNTAIDLNPENAHAYFRRAWSHKAVGGPNGFKKAGADFETAKKLRWDDPNFAIDYKRINQYEYMALESEPDLQYVFPSLLPRPGAAGL